MQMQSGYSAIDMLLWPIAGHSAERLSGSKIKYVKLQKSGFLAFLGLRIYNAMRYRESLGGD